MVGGSAQRRAFAKSMENFMAGGKHDGWWRGAGLTAGTHSHPYNLYLFPHVYLCSDPSVQTRLGSLQPLLLQRIFTSCALSRFRILFVI